MFQARLPSYTVTLILTVITGIRVRTDKCNYISSVST